MSLFSRLFGKAAEPLPPSGEGDEAWVLASRTSESGVSLIRIRHLPEGFAFGKNRFRLSVTWTYAQASGAGAPAASEMDRMERFELLLRQHIEAQGAALLTVIFTEPAFRQYVFYSADVGRFVKLLNRMPEDEGPWPIDIQQDEDETGAFYQSYASGLL